MNREELAWAGGLFEGEGCFSLCQPTPRAPVGRPLAQIGMTELVDLERFQRAVGFGRINGPWSAGRNLPMWRWDTGSFEKVQALVAMLWPWLGPTRRAKARAVLQTYAHRQASRPRVHRRYYQGQTCEAKGCMSPPKARGVCDLHYQRQMKGYKGPKGRSRTPSVRSS